MANAEKVHIADSLDREKVDPAWYLKRYPDVAEAGQDPAEHFVQFGRAEGRFPNANSEAHAGDVSGFDPAWYLKRYPDVAEAGKDPAEHFVQFGRAEGRFPNAQADSRELWSEQFDPAWYLARYKDVALFEGPPLEHFIYNGILEGRAPNAYAEKLESWREIFDAEWYWSRYEDVKHSDIDPLTHFILYGIVTERKPNKNYHIPFAQLESSELICLKSCAEIGDPDLEFGLFVTHSPTGSVKPHVLSYVRALVENSISIILIISTNASDLVISSDLQECCAGIYRRTNRGYDFAAWAHVLRVERRLLESKILYLLNDSVVGPVGKAEFKNSLERVRASKADIIGFTDNHQLGWHLQSYFLAVKRPILRSEVFNQFFSGVVEFDSKYSVIYEYETQLTKTLKNAGFECGVLFPATEMTNYTAYRWRHLLDQGFPFIKANILVRLIAKLDITNWRERLALKGYDTSIADRSLAQIVEGLNSSYVYPYYVNYGREKGRFLQMYNFFASERDIQLAGHDKQRVVLIIVAHNEAELLVDLFLKIEGGASSVVESCLVDVASTDDTVFLSKRVAGCTFEHALTDQEVVPILHKMAANSNGRPVLVIKNLRSAFDDLLRFLETAFEWNGSEGDNYDCMLGEFFCERFKNFALHHNLGRKWRIHQVQDGNICLLETDEFLLLT